MTSTLSDSPPEPRSFNVNHPIPFPHPHPLKLFAYGHPLPNTCKPRILTGPQSSPKRYKPVVNAGLALAVALLAHPNGLDLAAGVLSSEDHSRPIIKQALGYCLSAKTWNLLIDPGLAPNVFAVHCRPPCQAYHERTAHTIYINSWVSHFIMAYLIPARREAI